MQFLLRHLCQWYTTVLTIHHLLPYLLSFQDFAPIPKLGGNDYLRLASTFHGLHAITSNLSPTGSSSGIEVLESETFKLQCYQTPTGMPSLFIFYPLLFSFYPLIFLPTLCYLELGGIRRVLWIGLVPPPSLLSFLPSFLLSYLLFFLTPLSPLPHLPFSSWCQLINWS